jgi:hypothetical protein
MKKTISILAIIGISALLLGCTTAETVTVVNDGVETTFTPAEGDWCGDDCIVYPENGFTYVLQADDGLFHRHFDGPEISEEAQQEVIEQIEAAEEKYGDN